MNDVLSIPRPLTNTDKTRRLPWLLGFQVLLAAGGNLCIFGPVFTLFLGALGLDKTRIGFLLALLPLAGVLAPFVSSGTARFGYKRMAVTFFSLRMVVAGLLLLLPMVSGFFGKAGAFGLVAGVIVVFGVFRMLAENGYMGWMQEAIPRRIRGKYTALEILLSNAGGFAALLMAGLFLEQGAPLERYYFLIAVGVLLGLLSAGMLLPVPGGEPVRAAEGNRRAGLRGIAETLWDAHFRHLLLGVGLMMFSTSAVGSFLPLFLTERAGFAPGGALLTQNAMVIGVAVFSYFWGWAADRYGSRPIAVLGAVLTAALMPVWLTLPRHPWWSGLTAAGLFFLMGVANVAFLVSATRQLYLSMPLEKREQYIPAYYVVFNVSMALGALLAGFLLDAMKSGLARWNLPRLDPYLPLFVGSAVLCGAAAWGFQRMHRRGDMETRRFAGLFVQGNPLTAMGLLLRYRWLGEEEERVAFVEKLGDAKSPLTIAELVEMLHDPGFAVRYEAVNSIARMPPQPELIEALIALLQQGETELRPAAAWALGRLGDSAAIPALREALGSDYPLLRSRAARALGMLADRESLDALRRSLQEEQNPDLKVAYAAALGALQDRQSVEEILSLLAEVRHDVHRVELALALARILGGERSFLRLWRRFRGGGAEGAGAALRDLAKPLARWAGREEIVSLVEEAAHVLAREGLAAGGENLARLAAYLPWQKTFVSQVIFSHCASRLRASAPDAPVSFVLLLHVLQEQIRT